MNILQKIKDWFLVFIGDEPEWKPMETPRRAMPAEPVPMKSSKPKSKKRSKPVAAAKAKTAKKAAKKPAPKKKAGKK